MANSVRKKVYLAIKRLIDIIGSLIGIILLSPLYIIIAILIKFDSPGKVVFGHTRKGKGGKDIKVYKFRTMYSNASEIFESFTPEQKEEYYTNFKLDNDPRVTKLGGFLRKTSLDELPQLFNIVKGDMSIIGPRPALWNQEDLINEREKYSANDIRPGLTGWAQVNGRDELEIHVKAKYDGEYVDKISFLFDLKIFFKTIINVFKHDGIVEGRQ